MVKDNNNEISKLKKYALFLGVLVILTISCIAIAYNLIEINNKNALNMIQSENYDKLSSLNEGK